VAAARQADRHGVAAIEGQPHLPAFIVFGVTDAVIASAAQLKGLGMSELVVRNVEEDVKARLRVRAARHGRSMEEEAHVILRDSVGTSSRPVGGLGTQIAARFKDIGLRDGEDIAEIRGEFIKPWVFEDC
jgi:plasmid stability protein